MVELTSATSYLERNQRQTEDGSENWQDAFGEPEFTPGAAYVEDDTTRQFAQEVRLASAWADPFQWLVGGFYQKYHSGYFSSGVDQGFVTLYGFPSADVYTAYEPFEITQRAGFAQLSYQIGDAWKLALGLRHYDFDTRVSVTAVGDLATPPGQAGASAAGNNPAVTLSYSPTRDLMLYTTAAKGFRPGGANVPIPLSICEDSLQEIGRTSAPLTYNPDSLWSYEVGQKALLADARISVNSDVYYEKWSGVQQVINLSCGFLYTDNAATARIYGSEVEIKAKLGRNWIASTSAGYTNGVLTATSPGTTFVKGDRLQDVPNGTATVAIDYDRPLAGQYDLAGRASWSYVGTRVDLTYGINHVPGYTLGDVRLGVTTDRWSAYLFCDNVFDKIAELGNNSNLDVNIPSYNRVITNQPRTVGLELSARL
jgi:iron complex outermembrane recepter protein